MKKILLSIVTCTMLCVSFAQTTNISTGDGTTAVGAVDPAWKVNGNNTYTVASYLNYWQATPIQGCNARWINPSPKVGSEKPGFYVFERSITVPAGTKTLSLSLQVAYDDVLTSLELVPPTGPAIALTATNPKPYYLSDVINSNTDVCNKSGTWKIRAKVQYIDALGGFMLCGSATVSGTCCSCGKWGTTLFSGNGIQKQVACGQTIILKKGVPVAINPSYYCNGGCKSNFSAILTSPSGAVQNISSFPYSLIPTELGYYKLAITPICGDTKCTPCQISIYVTPGCPGDIFGGNKPTDFAYVEIASSSLENIKAGNFLSLDVNAKEPLFAGLPNGSYLLQLNKTEILLMNRKNNAVVEKYPFIPYVPDPVYDCAQQERDQWEIFNRDVAPLLVKRANETCQAVGYCFGTTCNGNPYTYSLLIVKPTNIACQIYTDNGYKASMFTKKIAE